MSAISVFAPDSATDYHLKMGLSFGGLRKVAVMTRDDGDSLLGRYRVAQPQGVCCTAAEQMSLAPWGVTIPLSHELPSRIVASRREIEVGTR